MAPSLTLSRSVAGATCAALITLIATPVLGADLLRGGFYEDAPPPLAPMRWDGPYIGGFGGYGDARINFSDFFSATVADALRFTALLDETEVENYLRSGSDSDGRFIYGGFAGYNYQADEVVFGFELDYTRGGNRGIISDSIGRIVATSNGYLNTIDLVGTGQATAEDWITFRGRAGFTSGIFMPYLTAGVAIGRFHAQRSVQINVVQEDADPFNPPVLPTVPYSRTGSYDKERWEPGFVAGAGVDVALGPNVFLRGEYQYITFQRAAGARFDMNLIKGAAGIRF